MAYQVLARKWRPKTFRDLVGQEHVVKALRNALDEGRLHHAYLLTGTRGVGKTTIARILAKSLNCPHAEHGEPCGVCESCTQIDNGRYVDLLEIDAASNTGIDNIREVLENAQYAPTAGKYKVYIIDEVHMLSKSAFNAMLKTLEEPPEHVKFILATTDPHKVPITVLSRCLQFVLRNMTTQQVADHLAYVLQQENIRYEPAALHLLGRAAMGSMRDALSLLDQAIAMGSGSVGEQDVRQMIGAVDKQYLYRLIEHLLAQDGEALVAQAQDMAARAIGFDNALSELAMLLQQLSLAQIVPTALASDPEQDKLIELAKQFSGEQLQLYYQCAVHGKNDLSLAPDEYAGFVMTLLRMLAFAPMAAKHTPVGKTIAGTELGGASEKKPLAAANITTVSHQPESVEKATQAREAVPQNKSTPSENHINHQPEITDTDKPGEPTAIATSSQRENASIQTAKDIPPWEEGADSAALPEHQYNSGQHNNQDVAEHHTATSTEILQTSSDEAQSSTASSPIPIAQPSLSASEDSIVEQHNISSDELLSQSESLLNNQQIEITPTPSEITATNSVVDGTIEQTQSHLAEEVDQPLPPFAAENWSKIVTALAKKLGAARMVALHAAWIDFQQDVLRLAVAPDAQLLAADERVQRIRDELAAAYRIPLTVQTEPWQPGSSLTPVMQDLERQQEARQQARRLLDSDPKAQQLKQFFQADWEESSLQLFNQAV